MKPFLIMIGTLLSLALVLTVLWGLGYDVGLLQAISCLGTMLILLMAVFYAGFESKSRWPDSSYWSRVGKILGFER